MNYFDVDKMQLETVSMCVLILILNMKIHKITHQNILTSSNVKTKFAVVVLARKAGSSVIIKKKRKSQVTHNYKKDR